MPLPAINIEALLMDKEENLRLEQIKGTHPGIMDLLGDLGSPLYAKPLSMMEFFDGMIVRVCHVGDLRVLQGYADDHAGLQREVTGFTEDPWLSGYEGSG